jgi:hypothetical protein
MFLNCYCSTILLGKDRCEKEETVGEIQRYDELEEAAAKVRSIE